MSSSILQWRAGLGKNVAMLAASGKGVRTNPDITDGKLANHYRCDTSVKCPDLPDTWTTDRMHGACT